MRDSPGPRMMGSRAGSRIFQQRDGQAQRVLAPSPPGPQGPVSPAYSRAAQLPGLQAHPLAGHTPAGPSANSAAALLWRTCLRSRWPTGTRGGGCRQLTSSRRSMLAFRQGVQDLSSLFSSSSCCSLGHKNKAGTHGAVPRPPHAPTRGSWAKASRKPGWCLDRKSTRLNSSH